MWQAGVGLLVLALVGGALGVFWPGRDGHRLVAHFDRAVGLYEGNDVRILGVRVGEVTAIQPRGTSVRVEMVYAAEHRVPADAKAVVVAPTLVSDRYVQLTPAYTKGPVLADGATIPQRRTATPVELDRVYTALNELSTALGPEGANSDGSLSRLLRVGARNLDGQGEDIHRTVEDLAQATGTLARGKEDLFGTVRNLQEFTTTLAKSDRQVERFNRQLADVSGQLSAEKEELGAALEHLSTALQEVEGFVRDNKAAVGKNVEDLTEITRVLAKEQKALAEVLDTAPLALSNLSLAYNPASGTLDNRMNLQQIQNPAMYVCSLAYSLDAPPEQCERLLAPLDKLGADHLPVSLDLSFLTRLPQRTRPAESSGNQGGASGSGSGSGGDSNPGGSGGSGGPNARKGGSASGTDGKKGSSPAPSSPEPTVSTDSSLLDMLQPGQPGEPGRQGSGGAQ